MTNRFAISLSTVDNPNIIRIECHSNIKNPQDGFNLHIIRSSETEMLVWFSPITPMDPIFLPHWVTDTTGVELYIEGRKLMHTRFEHAKNLSFGNWGILGFVFDRVYKSQQTVWNYYNFDMWKRFEKAYKSILHPDGIIKAF